MVWSIETGRYCDSSVYRKTRNISMRVSILQIKRHRYVTSLYANRALKRGENFDALWFYIISYILII